MSKFIVNENNLCISKTKFIVTSGFMNIIGSILVCIIRSVPSRLISETLITQKF